jgi:long-chain acyl-CoA synthetase
LFNGDITRVVEDIQELKPTYIVLVPRILNRLIDMIKMKLAAAEGRKKALVEKALATKLGNLKNGFVTHTFYDLLIFNKIKNILGGRIKQILVGSAPISQENLNLARIFFQCEVVESKKLFLYISLRSN